ncbi:hypothetical protein OH76DRAFT_1544274 [Lentinus brumalis]|uniref:Galactose oxidase n=1 Tax=Lentinus brumalis TaxID=2498619 RepID=A0A371CTJ6_9APHY|nr:hypothetical protein OH76DRAFT_1544274 [Polyporus brumalis]
MPSTDPRPGLDSPRLGGLTDVPEDAPLTPSARSPYFHHAVSGSATTFKPAGSATSLNSTGAPSRTPSAASQRTPSVLTRSGTGRSASGDTPSGMATPRRQRSGSPATVRERDNRDKDDKSQAGREREGREGKGAKSAATPPTHRIRNTPHLPHAKDVELAPATLMHWSRGPVFGAMPLHGTRAHTVTLIDNIAWMFGGCDERGCWQDVFCFNTATLVDRKIIVFGGGEGPAYYNDLYILDTATRKWSHPVFPADSVPPPRRAHTLVLYKNKLWIFGGGNGSTALNDVWTLDVSGSAEKLRWDLVETRAKGAAGEQLMESSCGGGSCGGGSCRGAVAATGVPARDPRRAPATSSAFHSSGHALKQSRRFRETATCALDVSGSSNPASPASRLCRMRKLRQDSEPRQNAAGSALLEQ